MRYKEELYFTKPVRVHKNAYKIRLVGFKYRFDPVPGIHHFKNAIRYYYRRIKTTQERRWALAHKEYVRGKRRFTSLPNSWDDLRNSKEHIKNWKRTKKRRQWE